jgi:hypothetical protein
LLPVLRPSFAPQPQPLSLIPTAVYLLPFSIKRLIQCRKQRASSECCIRVVQVGKAIERGPYCCQHDTLYAKATHLAAIITVTIANAAIAPYGGARLDPSGICGRQVTRTAELYARQSKNLLATATAPFLLLVHQHIIPPSEAAYRLNTMYAAYAKNVKA